MPLFRCWGMTDGETGNLEQMIKNKKTPSDSLATMTQLVLPGDTNHYMNLMGGRMMHWIDVLSAIVAHRHSNSDIVVTASVDNISFHRPIHLGDVVTLAAKVTRAFRTSMEIYIVAEAEDIKSGAKSISNTAFFTFVALDRDGKPISVPEIEPQTEEEKELYAGALRRRQMRLVLSGKMSPREADGLKEIFSKP